MTVAVRSFAKINLGLYIGAARADGYHDLRTVYQTIALHDVIRVKVARGAGIEVVCDHPRVPLDSSNTCYRMAERVLEALGANARVIIEIEKRLPVQGGLGAASSNAVATLMALELALKKKMSAAARLRIAAEVGSDLPLFLVGGTVLGVGRGEEVYPLPDLPAMAMVVVTPEIGVSTPQAFADWDALVASGAELRSAWTGGGARPHTGGGAELRSAGQPRAAVPTRAWTGEGARPHTTHPDTTHPDTSSEQLTPAKVSDRLFEVGCVLSAWLSGYPNTGASAKGGSRAGSLLLDLVRTGIENDFERVVFPQYPELRDIKGALERAGSRYAALSGSGSSLYGLFRSRGEAVKAASRLRKQGLKAVATSTLTRQKYWKSLVVGR
ncbi:MAG: 4-(cytidine 5'-diphospho)-2-C-methyl-D-erythritol kinase [Terriglobales bacterium]|jgi:4-diphosphocytidyl-2-C-methyl-D-erythritol kinase